MDLITLANMTYTNASLGALLWAGATYRPAESLGMSCQFYQPPNLNYIDAETNVFVVGVSRHLFRRSLQCHQCILINETVLGIIADYCPKCTPYQLDLNPFQSKELNSKEGQRRPRNYEFKELRFRRVDCAFGTFPKFYFDKGSSRKYLYLIPLFVKKPLHSVETSDGARVMHDTFGRWVTVHTPKLDCRQNYTLTGCYDTLKKDCFIQTFSCTDFLFS